MPLSKRISEAGRSVMVILIGFFVLLYLTLAFSILPYPQLILIFAFYAISPPFLLYVRHSIIYFITLPVPYIGSWVISIVYLSTFAIPVIHASVLVSAIPMILSTATHLFSRSRHIVGRVSMASFSRMSIAIASSIFYMVGLYMLGQRPIELDALNRGIFYGVLLFAFVASSMVFVNSAYRYRIMCRAFGTNRIKREMTKIWKGIRDKFSDKEEDVDLLQNYFSDATRLFEEGSYERSFLSGYKVINEPTVVSPKKHISDKREGEPSSFSEIRTILMHSRREKTEINVKRIREVRKELPKYCVEVLQRCFALLKSLS